ncbi:MAG: hypothetical protein K9I82_00015 [Chitinophagaceae bacterium]|nr:hypothetical protein [Chitinophagaceae bacterium]
MKVAVTFILLSIFSLQCFSQTYWIKKTPFFDFLYKLKKPVSDFYLHREAAYYKPIPLNGDFKRNYQILIKTKRDLFVLVNGTGIVLKATDTTKDKIAFNRIDSTIYHGYNFDAIQFPYHDTIFSLGGYGFWRFNGQLRYFHHIAEWDLIPINNEYPLTNQTFYFSEKDNLLIAVQDEMVDQTVGKKFENKNPIIEFDLKHKKNKIIGHLINSKIIPARKINFPYLNGLITLVDDIVYLYDYQHNKIYKSKNEILAKEMISSQTYFNKAFALENKIYFTKDSNDAIDSITVSMDDFEITSTPIYTPINANQPYYIILGVVLLMLPIFFFVVKKKKNTVSIEQEKYEDPKSTFTILEKLIIESIHSKYLNKETSTVEEINDLMGLAKKTNEQKKRGRTEIINSINQKFKIQYQKDTDLIIRERSELDKRYFQYTINVENIDFYWGKNR